MTLQNMACRVEISICILTDGQKGARIFKGKKDNKYNGRKISGCEKVLHWRSMASRVEISRCDLTDGWKGA